MHGARKINGKCYRSACHLESPGVYILQQKAYRYRRRKAALRKAKNFDTAIAPSLYDALLGEGEQRIHVVGEISALPLLATSVDGNVLGSSRRVAYRHPDTDTENLLDGRRDIPTLLVVDRCFGSHSQKLETVYRKAASALSYPTKVLTFNSNREDRSLPKELLIEALESAPSALTFTHVESPVDRAPEAGIILGPSSKLRLSEMASLNLKGLEELAFIGCASGRNNPFVGEATLAHAAAIGGAYEILYTLWPIRPAPAHASLWGC